jgi:hypothetical protein
MKRYHTNLILSDSGIPLDFLPQSDILLPLVKKWSQFVWSQGRGKKPEHIFRSFVGLLRMSKAEAISLKPILTNPIFI